jgi:hypothetical protein
MQMISGQKWEMYDSQERRAQQQEIPNMFSSLSKARESLVSHWHVASYSASDTRNPTTEGLQKVPQAGAWQNKSTGILGRWSSAYDAYLNIQGENLTDARKRGTAALRIVKALGSSALMLTRTMVDDQMNWDVFCPMFQEIVSLAEDIVELDSKSTEQRPPFYIDMSLVRPLFEVSLIVERIFPLQRSRKLYQVNHTGSKC